jgi:hypothetical protein
MRKETAEQIVADIMHDIIDRAGIGDEFEQIDSDIKQEIFDTWVEIIMSGSEVV